jgi:glycosyltransferase involved in cell wall biosynthesis
LNSIKKRLENQMSLQYLLRCFPFQALDQEPLQSADVINLHDIIGGYFNYLALPKLSATIPTCWSLHNMWAFTGHCSYSFGCDRWKTGCYQCPLLRLKGEERELVGPEPTLFDLTRFVWGLKKRLYSRSRLHIVVGSTWMKNQVEQSILAGGASIVHIPDGACIDLFKPVDREMARQSLNIPANVPVVMVYATYNPRKGLKYAIDALSLLEEEKRPWIISVGQVGALDELSGKYHIRDVGYIQSDILRNLCHNAADLMLLPTLADNLPLTVLDSLASGTPVISFRVGGVPDAVRHMETGYLAEYKNASDLANGIRVLLGSGDLRLRMRSNCRKVAKEEFSLGLQAQRYAELYGNLMEEIRFWNKQK